MIELNLENQTRLKSPGRKFFFETIEKAEKKLGLTKRRIGLGLILVNERKIRTLNLRHRHKDEATDVLAFSLGLYRNSQVLKSPADDIMELGDIFICLPIAKKRAQREGTTLKGMLSRLTVHSFLHLLGHEHEGSSARRRRMFSIEKRILNHGSSEHNLRY